MKGITIIICCYNSAKRLKPTLEHIGKLKSSACSAWELIIVDNASTDSTRNTAVELCESLGIDNCSIIEESNPGLMHARKKGVEAASYDIILFCDDDNWLHEDYIDNAARLFQSYPSAGIIGGSNSPVYEIDPPSYFEKYDGYLALGECANQEALECEFICGAGMVVRKQFLHEFFQLKSILTGRTKNSLLAGDDTEICIYAKQMGFKLYRSPALKLKHFIAERRINDVYIEKLHNGIGRSNFYIEVLERNLRSQSQFSFFLFKMVRMAVSGTIARAVPQLFFSDEKEKVTDRKNRLSYLRGFVSEICLNIFSLNDINSVINSNKKRINERKANDKEEFSLQDV